MNRRPALAQLWQRSLGPPQRALWLALTPLSALYAGALVVRGWWWARKAQGAPATTISIGNLTVGGSGKTPFALFLAGRLRQRGYRVAIVSRGYGRRPSPEAATLIADGGELLTDPASAGDEPAMMAHRFDGPIAVARRRIDAIKLLAARAPLDAVILDDAFQHQRLRRDLDLVLIATPQGVGNGWILPAGPLREPLNALQRADAVILVAPDRFEDYSPSPSLRAVLSTAAVLRARVRPRTLVHSVNGHWTESALELKGKRVVAVTGLAEPAGFSLMLRELGADLIETLEYPDHCRYSPTDWDTIHDAATRADVVLTTEKDLVKLEGFSPALASLYAVRLEITMPESDDAQLFAMVANCIKERSRPGVLARTGAKPAERTSG
jgi:tetraacyldisaccharide 4'-kinase